MPNKIDLTNKKYGKLTVIGPAPNEKGRTAWNCQCDCGKQVIKTTKYLRKYENECSCGCLRSKQLVGERYGNLVVLRPTEARHHRSIVWECQCDCGNITYATTEGLRTGDNVSCGCRREKGRKMLQVRYEMIGKRFGNLVVIGVSDNKTNQDTNLLICKCDCGNTCEVSYNHLTTGNTRSCGCLMGTSVGEKQIASILKAANIDFVQEYIFPELPNHRYDFAIFKNKKLVQLVEFDGEQHYKEAPFFKKTLQEQQQIDFKKTQFAKSINIPLIRIPYWERDHLTLEKILGEYYYELS